MRILIADDHDLVRDTLAAFLGREPDIDVLTAQDLGAALALIAEGEVIDLALLDYNMPGMNGLAGLSEALEHPNIATAALMSGTANRAIAQEALDAGAIGFLPKTMGAASVLNAVRFMGAGEVFAPVKFMTTAEEPMPQSGTDLSARERDVLVHLCKGDSNKEIARKLDLQEVTIKLHVKTLSRKLAAKNRTQAAMIARDMGLV